MRVGGDCLLYIRLPNRDRIPRVCLILYRIGRSLPVVEALTPVACGVCGGGWRACPSRKALKRDVHEGWSGRRAHTLTRTLTHTESQRERPQCRARRFYLWRGAERGESGIYFLNTLTTTLPECTVLHTEHIHRSGFTTSSAYSCVHALQPVTIISQQLLASSDEAGAPVGAKLPLLLALDAHNVCLYAVV